MVVEKALSVENGALEKGLSWKPHCVFVCLLCGRNGALQTPVNQLKSGLCRFFFEFQCWNRCK